MAQRVLPFGLDRPSPNDHGLEEFLEELVAGLRKLEQKNRQLEEQTSELSMALQEMGERLARIEALKRQGAAEAKAPQLPPERGNSATDFEATRSPWRIDSLELVASPFRNFAALVAFHRGMQRLGEVHVQGFQAGKLHLSLHFPRPVPMADPLMELSQLPVRLVSLDESRIEVEICGRDGLDR
ncbi:MAG: hypothetical protein ACYC5J_17350 [Chloroflexota bacterium]